MIIGEARQHLAVQVATFIVLPLLEPVEVTRAHQRVVPQNPGEKNRGNELCWLQFFYLNSYKMHKKIQRHLSVFINTISTNEPIIFPSQTTVLPLTDLCMNPCSCLTLDTK